MEKIHMTIYWDDLVPRAQEEFQKKLIARGLNKKYQIPDEKEICFIEIYPEDIDILINEINNYNDLNI